MGNELRYVCLVETRRYLLLMGVVFGLILFVQYFELPYSSILSSLFSAERPQVVPIDNFRNSSRNLTYLNNLNSTDMDGANGASFTIRPSGEKDGNATNVNDDFDSQNSKNLDDTSNNDIDPEDEAPSKDLLGTDHNSTIESIVRNNNFPLDENIGKSESPENRETSSISDVEASSSTTSIGKDVENMLQNKENPTRKEGFASPEPGVVPISKMNDMLLQSHVSYRAVKPRWSSTVDQEILNAKSLIVNASVIEKDNEFDVNLFRNFSEFKRSYELMEQTLKVYIYAEGERPIFHQPPLKGIYASEGWFMKLLKSNKIFVTKNPKKAHLFYLPFSSRMLEVALYVPDSHNRDNLIARLSDYVELITKKYHFWNRTDGADHFLVACHDWAPAETKQIMPNCIRSLCNSDIKEGFRFGKDISLPETFVRSPQNPLRQLGGKPPSQRRTLAFFAGSMHGYLRPILLNHWENKDPDMKIFGRIRKKKGQMSYAQYMKSSKYCICAKGFEVNSPRVVEAIFYECVPVIISDNFVPPFFETLNWESFAVFVLEKDIPNLKSILLSISEKNYVEMQRRVRLVQKHFLWHSRPVKYDVFHMILHSVWYNRVFQTGYW